MNRLLACVVLVAFPCVVSGTWQPEKKTPDKTEPQEKKPTGIPIPAGDRGEKTDDAAAFLAAFAENFKLAKSFTYKTKVTNLNGSETAAEVSMDRADAGGWKFKAKGDTKASKTVAKGRPFEVSFDGADVKSVRDSEKQIGELSAPDTKDEIRAFFIKERANSPIIWELLEETPFEFAKKETVKLEPEVEIDGEKCAVIRITVKDDKPASADNADYAGGVYTFRAKDKTLVKVERYRPSKKADEKPVRSIEMTDATLNESGSGTDYSIDTPKGYTVKPEPKKLNKPKK